MSVQSVECRGRLACNAAADADSPFRSGDFLSNLLSPSNTLQSCVRRYRQRRRQLSQQTASIGLETVDYAIDVFAWSGKTSNLVVTKSVAISDSSGSPQTIEDLSKPVVMSLPTTSTAAASIDVRTRGGCVYFDKTRGKWWDRGVYGLGLSMSDQSVLCATHHFSSFTANAAPEVNVEVLKMNPTRLSAYGEEFSTRWACPGLLLLC